MSLLKNTKPENLPNIYGYVDEFWRQVDPKLESLLDRRKRKLNLSQTFGTAYNAFHPFLLDYPLIVKCISQTDKNNKASCLEFWECFKQGSVYPAFEEARPKLNELHERSKKSFGSAEGFEVSGKMQNSALDTLVQRLPEHFCKSVFKTAFDRNNNKLRNHFIGEMQDFCPQLEKRAGLHNSEILDLFNMTIYQSSLAKHCYTQIHHLLETAYDFATGQITLKTSIPNYVYNQWRDVTSWFGIYKTTREVGHSVVTDLEMNRFYVTVFYLRDTEIGPKSFETKCDLLAEYLRNKKQAKLQLTTLLKKFPFAAPYWAKQYLKLDT